jgi:NAD(P)-dependent dehydrogenase (short-subunit alcohol dehydrogenase family)
MTIDLSGRVAIVTGAGGGLGRTHAMALARYGARVVVNDMSADGVEVTVAEITAAGGEAVGCVCSVTDRQAVSDMVQGAVHRWGSIDILVNNAGILRDRTFAKMDLDDFELVLSVHLMGSVNVTKAAWPFQGEHGLHRRHRGRRHHRRLHVRLRQRRHQRHAGRPGEGLQSQQAGHRPERRRDPDRLRVRRFRRGPPGRRLGPPHGDDHRRPAVPGQRHRHGRRPHLGGVHRLPPDRRPGRGRGLGALPGLHLGSHARQHPRPPVVRAADHDHHRPDRRVRGQLHPGPHRRQLDRAVLAGPARLALDVLDADHPRRDLLLRPAGHPGKPALPGRQGQGGRGREDPVAPVRRRPGRRQGRRDPRLAGRPTTSRSSRTCWTRRPARSARSCGPAWSWPSSSNWSASTSSSTTARCCGSRWASPRTTA